MTVHHFSSDGSSIARGTNTVADNDTVSTGLTSVTGFVASAKDADTVISFASQSAGVVTVRVFAAGVSSGGTKQFYWEAWNANTI